MRWTQITKAILSQLQHRASTSFHYRTVVSQALSSWIMSLMAHCLQGTTTPLIMSVSFNQTSTTYKTFIPKMMNYRNQVSRIARSLMKTKTALKKRQVVLIALRLSLKIWQQILPMVESFKELSHLKVIWSKATLLSTLNSNWTSDRINKQSQPPRRRKRVKSIKSRTRTITIILTLTLSKSIIFLSLMVGWDFISNWKTKSRKTPPKLTYSWVLESWMGNSIITKGTKASRFQILYRIPQQALQSDSKCKQTAHCFPS